MEEKITLKPLEDGKEEEKQPLNTMVTKNLKEIIIQKIYKNDTEINIVASRGRLSPVARQYIAASGMAFSQLSCGMAAGFSAVLLPQLMAENTEIVITKEQGSWIASLLALPLIFGCLFSGYLLQHLGRKKSVCVSTIGLGVGWCIVALAPDVSALYAGRFITGFCVSLVTPPVQVYIAETSQPEHRGILLSGSPLAVAVGILIAHVLGTFLSWRISAWLCTIPVVVSNAILPFIKESPVWLLQKVRPREAEEAFIWFRGVSENAIKEFKALKINEQGNNMEEDDLRTKLKKCFNPSFVKPFLILNFFFFTQQFSGVNAVTFYSVNILKKVMTNLNEYFSTVLIDVVRAIASVVAVVLLKRYGRKQLSVVSAIGTSISLFLLTLYLAYANSRNDEPLAPSLNQSLSFNFSNGTSTNEENSPASFYLEIIGFLPLFFLVSYICFISLGLVPLPWVLTGELFSKDMRGLGSGMTSSFGFLCFFIVVKSTPELFENLNDYGTFCLFGVIASVGTIVLWMFLPETKDKTLLEIEAHFNKKKQNLRKI